MSGMDQFLAEYYGTNGTDKTAAASNQEDLEKDASVELFLKVAGEQNIDIANMPDEQVAQLYAGWTQKVAEANAAPAQTGPTVEDIAAAELAEKQAAAEKVSEADFLGRVMAHAYVQEVQKIAAAAEAGGGGEGDKEAAPYGVSLKAGLDAVKGHAGKAYEAGKGHAAAAGKAIKDKAEQVGEHVKRNRGKYEAGGAAATAAASGGAGYAAGKHKKGSAIDDLAAERAVHIAHESGFDAEQAGHKVAAVRELDLLKESEKVASAPDVDTAVGIRALEYLEAAGYPVTWNQ